MRLDRLLCLLAVGTRTEVQRLIRTGRVAVGGEKVTDPSAHTDGRAVLVDGKALDMRLTRHLMLNKPSGVLTAADDRRQRTVMDILPPVYRTLGCMPIGRLDKDTTGLLLLTTDGMLAHRLLSPKSDIKKVYLAKTDTPLREEDCKAFSEGLHFKDFDALPALLQILSPDTAQITVSEGKFHQVKRMLHAVGHETLALKRLSFGPLALDETLSEGQYRELGEGEAAALYEAARMKT